MPPGPIRGPNHNGRKFRCQGGQRPPSKYGAEKVHAPEARRDATIAQPGLPRLLNERVCSLEKAAAGARSVEQREGVQLPARADKRRAIKKVARPLGRHRRVIN